MSENPWVGGSGSNETFPYSGSGLARQPFAPGDGLSSPPPAGYAGTPVGPVETPLRGHGPQPVPELHQPAPRWYRRWWVWLVAVIVVAGAVVAAIIASRPTFSLEKKLAEAIRANGDKVTAVSCPAGVGSSAGTVTSCKATVNGYPTTLRVRFRGDKDFVATYENPAP